jgi:hypothetical protein
MGFFSKEEGRKERLIKMITESQIHPHWLSNAYCKVASKTAKLFTKEALASNMRGKGEREHTAEGDAEMGHCAMLACNRHLFGPMGYMQHMMSAHLGEMIPLKRIARKTKYISDDGEDVAFLPLDYKSSRRSSKAILDHYAIVNRREYHEDTTYIFCIVEERKPDGRMVNICGWATSPEVFSWGPFVPPHPKLASFKDEYATQIKNLNPVMPMPWKI